MVYKKDLNSHIIEKITKYYEKEITDSVIHLDMDICDSMSPIEKQWFITWDVCSFKETPLQLIHQKKEGPYFIDFSVNLSSAFQNSFLLTGDIVSIINDISPKIGIELDGHDFHEKTKEQVENDKKRERYLRSKGWQIFRYSGSEVYKNCINLVLDLKNYCDSEIIKIQERLFYNLKKIREKKGVSYVR